MTEMLLDTWPLIGQAWWGGGAGDGRPRCDRRRLRFTPDRVAAVDRWTTRCRWAITTGFRSTRRPCCGDRVAPDRPRTTLSAL